MKNAELQGKSVDELTALLTDRKKEALNLRFQQTTGELANTARIRVVRRDIAKINTQLSTLAKAA
jgi:large subunit ribosomal protein L29